MVVPPLSISSPKNDSTSDCCASMIAIARPSHVSNPTTTEKVDTDVDKAGNSQSFKNPRKHKHSAT